MIVKFLRKSETFKGVNYNSRKMDNEKGELMLVSGFGALQGLENLRPADYINYLEAVSSRSSKIEFPQLHVTISCKGHSHTKAQLTDIASGWMKGMGYGGQPYLVIYHNDTANAHVHIVSTRVDRKGKKIDDSFERLKAYQVLSTIMAQDPAEKLSKDIKAALAYRFSTRAQFAMLLEAKRYHLVLKSDRYELYKFGQMQGTVPLQAVDQRISGYEKDKVRIQQLRAIVEKYRLLHSGEVFPVSTTLPGGIAGPVYSYGSDLAKVLQQKFGLQVLYHGAPGKPPFGFSVLDHKGKMVLKGKELMDVRELVSGVARQGESGQDETAISIPEVSEQDSLPEKYIPIDRPTAVKTESYQIAETSGYHKDYVDESPFLLAMEDLSLDISDDVDDEQILGPTRRRKRKARTNTR